VATDLWIPVFLVAPAAGSELSTTDVTKAWVEQELFADQLPSRPLSTTQGYLAPYVPPGSARVGVTVPTVKDEVAETDEYVDFEVASLGPDPLPNPTHLLGPVTNGP
jgi:hypothetical protein